VSIIHDIMPTCSSISYHLLLYIKLVISLIPYFRFCVVRAVKQKKYRKSKSTKESKLMRSTKVFVYVIRYLRRVLFKKNKSFHMHTRNKRGKMKWKISISI
jgi:hypothetical protein